MGLTDEKQDEEIITESKQDETEQDKLKKALKQKRKEKEEDFKSVQLMIEEKSKEMTNLITSAEEIEDSQLDRRKKIALIDEQIKDLENKKSSICIECKNAEVSIEKIEKKKRKLESFIDTYAAKAKVKSAKVDEEIESLTAQLVNYELKESTNKPVKPKVAANPNPELLNFINRQIEEKEREL